MASELTPEIRRSVLLEAFALECDLIGSENLDDLCEGYQDFNDNSAGYRMDVSGTLGTLGDAVTVIGFAWTVLQSRQVGNRWSLLEIDQIVTRKLPEKISLSDGKRFAIYTLLEIKQDDQVP